MSCFDRRLFVCTVLPAAATMLLSATRPAVAAPFTNGSFESPALTKTSSENLDASTAPAGWFVPPGDFNGFLWNASLLKASGYSDMHASDGDQFVSLQGNNLLGSIGQTFDTKPGQAYQVAFDLSAISVSLDGSNPPQTFTLTATAPGVSQDFSLTTAGLAFDAKGIGTDPWTHDAFDFVANGSTSTLTFVNQTLDLVGKYGTSLDNVTVRPVSVPEPAALMSIVLGGAWRLLSRPRRRPARCAS